MNVKIFTTTVIFVLGIFSGAALAQFPQMQKGRERLDESERASAAAKDGPPAPAPFRAKMNVDVQMLFANQDVKTFAEAKLLAVTRIADGDPLWMYLKFNGLLGKYVLRSVDENGASRNLLVMEVSQPGDIFAKYHYILSFTDAELALGEIKVALTSGIPGRNRSLPILLRVLAAAKPAANAYELRVTNSFGFPRASTDYLTKLTLTADLTKSANRYPQLLSDYDPTVLRGTIDKSKLPIEGKFDDAGIRARLMSELGNSGVEPAKLYFAADDWLEFSTDQMNVFQQRSVTAAFTYSRDGRCYYGTAEITQPFDAMTNRYGSSTFKIERDLPTPCAP